jgi:hypothetical protein
MTILFHLHLDFLSRWKALSIGQRRGRICFNKRIGKGEKRMKQIDWQMVYFVGVTLLKEYWCYIGLPRVYYWRIHDHDDRKAA